MNDRIRFHNRIVGRALLYVILPMVAIVALLIFLGAKRDFRNLRAAAEEELQAQTTLAAEQIEDFNHQAALTARHMAEAQMAGMFGDRPISMAFARMILNKLDKGLQFTGAYVGYEPDADGQDAKSLGALPAKAMTASGRFVPYYFRSLSRNGDIELEPLVDMETSLYYQGVKKQFAQTREPAPMITEPYIYQGKMIFEQTYPIVIDGRFKGVAGVDRALTDLEKELRELAEDLEVDAFLISSGGKFIAATTDPVDAMGSGAAGGLKTRPLAETAYNRLFGPLFRKQAEQALLLAEDPTDQAHYYFAAARIDTGGWQLILRDPEAAILAPIYSEILQGAVISLVGVLLILGIITFSAVRLSNRVNLAVNVADEVAGGDLTREISADGSSDETGVLLRSIGAMTGNLNGLIGQVKKSSIQLNSTATELAATSREQDAAVSTFGASANQIAAAAREISSTGTELAQTMNEVSCAAGGTAELASSGQVGLQNMESSMKTLGEATQSIAGKLAVINDRASNISGVVTTISKVAEQTNLLSVNAAIEAEKAGEYGVGFLVVAREIRRLADQTAAATLNIEQMVEQMQSAVSTGVMEMDRFSDRVRHSVKDVAEIGGQMEQIIDQVRDSSGRFERVLDSVESQSQGTEQINQAMGQLTGVAQQSVEANQEFARAARDLQDSISSLQSAIASFNLKS